MQCDDDNDSLFGSDIGSEISCTAHEDQLDTQHDSPIASRSAPDIPGMLLFPDIIPRSFHDHVVNQVSDSGYFAVDDGVDTQYSAATSNDESCAERYKRSTRNQAMLFARSLPINQAGDSTAPDAASNFDQGGCAGLPFWAIELIQKLQRLLTAMPENQLPSSIKSILFPRDELLSRQLILNLYSQGDGLSPHVDLVNRFADGILLCSFGPQGTGTVMDFTHESKASRHLFLPSGSVLILSGEARYDWKHGITARRCDIVRSVNRPDSIVTINRSIRLSITIRTMLPGADIVGQ